MDDIEKQKKEVPENGKPTVEADKPLSEDAEYEKTLQELEQKEQPELKKPTRSELEKAEFTAKSVLKRVKELGGNPSSLLEDEPKQPEKPEVDTSQFVTKLDIARAEATKLAKSPSEAKLIMWYVEHKGMTVEDAHYLANKDKIKKIVSEVSRANNAIPANPNGGAGQRPEDRTDAPELPEVEKRRLTASGMVYDPAKKAYVGKKIQHRYDEKSKQWVTEKIS